MPINMTGTEPWRQAVVGWYSGGNRPNLAFMWDAMGVGLPPRIPEKPKDRVRLLSLAGFDAEDLVAAVPELDADLVLRVASVSKTVKAIFQTHRNGKTPLEISRDTGITRPKVYYWLTRFNLTPHRHVREVLNARQRTHIIQAYNRGDRLVDIASRFNMSYDQVRYAVKKGTQ